MSRVLVVDAHPLMRRAIGAQIEALGHTPAGEAGGEEDAVALCGQTRPDLVIVELLVTPTGFDLIRRLKAASPGVRVLVYSAQPAEHFATRSLQAGADGFVDKGSRIEEFSAAIQAVLHGHGFFPHAALASGARGDASHAELSRLSPRELTVLQLLCSGLANQTIADQLGISFKTVSTYKTRLLQKLDAANLVELIDVARRHGVVQGATTAVTVRRDAAFQDDSEMLRAMLEASPNPMFVRDRSGRITQCNQALLDYHGVRVEDIRMRQFGELGWWHSDEYAAALQARYDKAMEVGEAVSADRVYTIRGEEHWMHVWFVPYRDDAGTVVGMVGGFFDLREQAARNAVLRHAKEAAEARMRLNANIMEQTSSALEQHVGIMGGLLERIASGDADTSAQVLAALGQSLMDRLAALHDLARLQNGSLALAAEPVSLAQVSQRAIDEVLAQARGHHLTLDASGLVIDRVWLDEARYRQILNELLAGLFDANVRLRSQLAEDGTVRLTLDLTGTGERQALQWTGAPAAGGEADHGFGLAVGKALVEFMGGHLSCRSVAPGAIHAVVELHLPQVL
ncbi:MAG: LuxR C-terminal-related transcriptional regulator [Rhodocyclaceae bacterium]